MDEKTFFKVLEEKYSELLKVCLKKSPCYHVYLPPYKYLSPNMLNKGFYENHIYCRSEYNPSLLISLNGKVLSHNQSDESLQTFIGFKKPLKFGLFGEVQREVNVVGSSSAQLITVINIDNVIDENSYNSNISKGGKDKNQGDKLIKMSTKEEYLAYYKSLQTSSEFREVEIRLQESTKRLINDYILMKGHESSYGQLHFQEEIRPIEQVIFYLIKFSNLNLSLKDLKVMRTLILQQSSLLKQLFSTSFICICT